MRLHKNDNAAGETVHTELIDSEPMEAQESETTQADPTEVIDLTMQANGTATEITESC